MSTEIIEKQKHLDELTAFIGSRVYEGFVAARKAEIEIVKQQILNNRPTTQENIAIQLHSFGEWDNLESMVTIFEDAARNLKARISEMTDLETESGATKT